MNNHRALTLSSVFVAMACLSLAAPAAAQSECQPGDLFCAELHIGPGRAGIRVGGGVEEAPPPPPLPEPQPPVVVVQPAPPPPPPQVYVQPAPQPQPPTVVVQPAYQPPPQQVYVQQPVVERRVVQRDRFPYSSMGLHLHIDGVAGDDLGMGGAGVDFRLRPNPYLAIDLGAGMFGGVDYNGLDRVEIPVTATGRLFFNPQHRFQFYGLLQLGGSWSHAEGVNRHTNARTSRDYGHLGGAAGLGAEWRISRVFALNLDVRGFLRHRVDGDDEPEFIELTDEGWQSTDFSGGVAAQFGMTFYWGM